jgi:hypothetical protein
VYNNEIHIIGSDSVATNHYKWNGAEWVSVSTLPYGFYQGDVAVYNNEIHIMGGYESRTNHYKWTGTEWVSVSTLPYQFNLGETVIYDDVLYIMGGSKYPSYFYKLNTDHPKATLTFVAQNLLKDSRKFHSEWTVIDGYAGSDIREWLAGNFMNTLPSDLQSNISEIIKKSDKGPAIPNSTTEKVWLLSYSEVGMSGSTSVLPDQGEAYSVFTSNGSRRRRTVNGSSDSAYWLRTTSSEKHAGIVGTTGAFSTDTVNSSRYVLIGFCI